MTRTERIEQAALAHLPSLAFIADPIVRNHRAREIGERWVDDFDRAEASRQAQLDE